MPELLVYLVQCVLQFSHHDMVELHITEPVLLIIIDHVSTAELYLGNLVVWQYQLRQYRLVLMEAHSTLKHVPILLDLLRYRHFQ